MENKIEEMLKKLEKETMKKKLEKFWKNVTNLKNSSKKYGKQY